MKTDIEIQNEVELKNIVEIADKVNLSKDSLICFGEYKAKIDLKKFQMKENNQSKLVLVTAMSPTPLGEGKTTTTIGLLDGLRRIDVDAIAALREPSLGPVFGIKGGATGGGYAQVAPMVDINLHFTGDFHAISAANNLIAAVLDNSIFQGNELNIDLNKIIFKRVVDMNDRQLRNIVCGLGKSKNGIPREEGFDITVASEIMAVFCLANDFNDLRERISRIVVAYNKDGEAVTVSDLKITGAVLALLRDAFNPNIVQTLEHSPVIIHGGPFANIAHGCNSVVATKAALSLAKVVVTEAGFGADLGAEKFFDIKCRSANLVPSCVVLVATIRSLKFHGGVPKEELTTSNIEALEIGIRNLIRHIENIKDVYNLPICVAINKFGFDTDKEIQYVENKCKDLGVDACICEAYEKGGEGAIKLAEIVKKLMNEKSDFHYAYDIRASIEEKINAVAKKIYRAENIEFSQEARKQLVEIEKLGYGKLPICIAKTQYSFSDDPKKLGAPNKFTITIRNLKISAGAGFIVALTGEIMTMPGLPKVPAAESIDVDEKGDIIGVF